MQRRTFLATGTALTLGLIGCLDDLGENGGNNDENGDTEADSETKNDNETKEDGNFEHGKDIYIEAVHVEEDEVDRDTDDICEFEDLSPEVQEDVSTAIEEGSFSTSEPAYESGHECYGAYIHYEGEYYTVVVAE